MTRAVELAVEVTIVFTDSTAFQVTYMGDREWGISLTLGFVSIVLGALICLLHNPPIAQSAFREALHPHALTAEASSLYPNSLALTSLTSRTITSSRIPSLHLQILQHLAGARMFWNYSHTRNGRRNTRLRAHTTRCARYTTRRD